MGLPPTLILDVRFYATKAGAGPVRDWLRSLPQHIRKIINDDMQDNSAGLAHRHAAGAQPGAGIVGSSHQPPDGITRVLFATNGPMVLVHGFIKKSQQTRTALA